MPENAKVQDNGAYANLCLTVIAGCLIYLCYRTTTTDTNPTKVEIVRIASKLGSPMPCKLSQLDTPMPCKLMFKKKSRYPTFSPSTQWTDEGALGVQLVGGEKTKDRMQVEIVGVASDIQNPLPITTKHGKNGGLFGGTPSNDEAIAVRLVEIKKPASAQWDAIPARLTEIKKGAYATWNAIPVEGTPAGWPVEVRVAP